MLDQSLASAGNNLRGIRDALSSRLVVGLAGCDLSADEKRWLDRWHPAGVILFARNCCTLERWMRLVAELREVLPPDRELCVDHEGGAVSFLQVLAGRPPAARTLGELDDLELTSRIHRQTADRLRGLGIDRVLAPCCDVLREPHNPVIGSRSFGTDADHVARHAAAAMKGLRQGGIKGCVKHWPGHGSSLVDTHDMASDQPAGGDHRPFLEALAAGADALMVGHLSTRSDGPPMTLDSQRLETLRGELAPGVLLYSDDVSMGALRAPLAAMGVPPPDRRGSGLVDPAVLSFDWLRTVAEAGCDRLLLRGIPWQALPLSARDGPGAANTPIIPSMTAPALDLMRTGPPSPLYTEARRRAVADVALRHGMTQLLWFDATDGDRLGEAASLLPTMRSWWPKIVRIDDAAVDSQAPQSGHARLCTAMLVTSHRPLNARFLQMIGHHASAGGSALAAGHPSLAEDLGRLLGSGWRIDVLYDCAGPDLEVLGSRGIA